MTAALAWSFAAIALGAAIAWLLNRVHVRPRDLADEEQCSDWSGFCGDCDAPDGKHRPHCPAWRP